MPFDVIDQDGGLLGHEEEKIVRAIICYNAFELSDRTIADIKWDAGKTLANYLDGLPEDREWVVYAAGRVVVDRQEWETISLVPDDQIIISRIPTGPIIPLIAIVALAIAGPAVGAGIATAFGFAATGLLATVIGGIITLAGGLLVNALMAPPKPADYGQGGNYSINGPKNTATEGTVVPVVYGTFRMAGNLVNIYTDNLSSPSQQTLYMQFVVSEGPIAGISDIHLNDQPIENFLNFAQWQARLGGIAQPGMGWFSNTTMPFNINGRVGEPLYDYITHQPCNRIRLDLQFPQGLFSTNTKTGALENWSVTLTGQYRQVETSDFFVPLTDWVPLQTAPQWQEVSNGLQNSGSTQVTGVRLVVVCSGNPGEAYTPYNFNVQLAAGIILSDGNQLDGNNLEHPAGWVTVGGESGNIQNAAIWDPDTGVVSYIPGTIVRVYEFDNLGLSIWNWNLQNLGAATSIFGQVETFYAQNLVFTNNYRGTLNYSITTPPLPLGTYELQFGRTSLESNLPQYVDEVWLTDINEVTDELVTYNRTAYYGVQLVLGQWLSGEPNCTALVQGKLVNIYDRLGNILAFEWSNNPADVALDILLNPAWRFAISSTRIDFASFDDWRQFCYANALAFNGAFDAITNVWDAVTQVMRVGRAAPSTQGLRWGVVVEGIATPVMMFTQDMIVKDTFQNQWTGRKNRANLIEVQYWNQNDLYRQWSAFALDDTFVSQGDALVQATFQMVGITDPGQAANEAYLQLNLNRYLTQSIQFDVFVQALGCAVGDVVYVQHDMPAWGFAVRVLSFDGTTVYTDSAVPSNGESDWRLLVLKSVVLIGVGWVGAVISATKLQINNIQVATGIQPADVPTFNAGDPTYTQIEIDPTGNYPTSLQNYGVHRIMINGQDFDVVDSSIVQHSTYFDLILTLDRGVSGVGINTEVELFKINVMSEATLAPLPTPISPGYQALPITSWITDPGNPQSGDRVMVGRVNSYKKPFRIIRIEHKDDNTRTISAIEYNESIYGPNPQPTANYSAIQQTRAQVIYLYAQQGEFAAQGGGLQYFAQAFWTVPQVDNAGYGGALVYASLNASGFFFWQDVPAGTTQCNILAANPGDIVRFKVVAYNQEHYPADPSTAPIAAVQIQNSTIKPESPAEDHFVASGALRTITVSWQLPSDDYVSAVQLWENTVNNITTATLAYQGLSNKVTLSALLPNTVYYFWLRGISPAGVPGPYVGPINAATTLVQNVDLSSGSIQTQNFATGIAPIQVGSGQPSSPPGGNSPVSYDPANGTMYYWNGTAWVRGGASMDASQITGTLTYEQIASVNATAITGQLTASQIASIDAATALLGTVPVTNLPNIDAMTGTLSTAQQALLDLAALGGQVSTAQIAAAAVTGTQIAAATITGANIVAGSINAIQIAANSITATQIAANTIVAGNIAASTITAANIAAGTITSAQIATNTILATNIMAGTITANEIAAATILGGNIAAGTIEAAHLAIGNTHNVIWNGCCSTATVGWTASSSSINTYAPSFQSSIVAQGTTWTWTLPGYGGGYIFFTQTLSSGEYCDLYWTPMGHTGAAPYYPANTCSPGDTWEAQAKVITSNCDVELLIIWFDSSGAFVSQSGTGPQAFARPANGTTLANWNLLYTKGTCPAGASLCTVFLRPGNRSASQTMFGANSGVTPLFNFVQVGFGQCAPNSTTPSPWAPGGLTTIDGGLIQTGTIQAGQIAAGAITSAQIAAGSILGYNIAANTIVGGQIMAGQISASHLAAGFALISSAQIGSLTVGTLNIQDQAVTNMTSTSLYTGIDGDNIATLVLNLTVTTTQAYDGVALVCFNQEFLGSTNINTIIEMEVNGTQIYNNVGAQFDEFVAFMAPFGMVSGSNNFTLYWTGASANVRIAQRTMVIFGRIK